jgi:hypothetical protein
MYNASLKYLAIPLLLFPLWLFNCAPRLQLVEGGRYSDPQGYFELTLPQDGWQLLSWKGIDFALWDPDEGATFVVDVTSLKEDVELVTLARHLLIAFERKRILSQGAEKLNGREAVKTVLEGWVENTEVKAEAYVVRGDGVFYDIIFWAPRETFPRTVDAFRQLLVDITFLQP